MFTVINDWLSNIKMLRRSVSGLKYIDASNPTLPTTLLYNGVVPSALHKPTVTITINALELFRIAHNRSLHLSIQAYVKSLYDLHRVRAWLHNILTCWLLMMQVEFKVYLSRQFSIMFDLYIQIHAAVKAMVIEALHHNLQDWKLRDCCQACMYTLHDELPLQFKMLYAMDGNDSLKRVSRALFSSSKLPTGQHAVFDYYYLPRCKDDRTGGRTKGVRHTCPEC